MRKLKFILLIASLCFIFSACEKAPKEAYAEEPAIEEITEEVTEEKEPEHYTARITAIGDIMVHSWQYNEAYNSETGEYDFYHNFTDVKKYFAEGDIVVGNLETVFAGADRGISDYPCFNTPDSFADALKDSGVDLVTTANNHCMDKGGEGLLRTIEILDEKGFDHMGTYADEQSRNKILIKNVNGINMAFLSYTYGTNGIPVPEKYMVNLMDEELIRSDIARAKALNPDIIIVMPHMGNEYETYTKDIFKDWADIMFDAGADIILASHPHVLQPMEVKTIKNADGTERQGFIIYSLGNFISSQTTPPRNASIILNIDVSLTEGESFSIDKVSFTPIWTQFRNASDVDDFCVRSVYEMLTLPESEMFSVIRRKDLNRLKDIHFEVTQMYLDYDVPLENIQDSYVFYEKEEN